MKSSMRMDKTDVCLNLPWDHSDSRLCSQGIFVLLLLFILDLVRFCCTESARLI